MGKLTIATVGAVCKAWLKIGCKEVHVEGLKGFHDLIKEGKARGRGVLTIANHISVLDEPTVWGTLPMRSFFGSHTSRWTLGASDIMFTKPWHRLFFTLGQVIETHRGQGIFQSALDKAIGKLNQGHWVHLFPEGYVNQTRLTRRDLRRFKWGVSRLLLEADEMPVVIPLWLTGFDEMMPEPRACRPFPQFAPIPGKTISLTFGSPIDHRISDLRKEWRQRMLMEGKDVTRVRGLWNGDESGIGRGQLSNRVIDTSISTAVEQDARREVLKRTTVVRGEGEAQTEIAASASEPSSPPSKVHLPNSFDDQYSTSMRSRIASLLRDELRALGKDVRARRGGGEVGASLVEGWEEDEGHGFRQLETYWTGEQYRPTEGR